jgi:hypothetical protein
MRLDSTPALAGNKIDPSILVRTRESCDFVIVLNDVMVAVHRNNNKSIRHSGVLNGMTVPTISIFIGAILFKHITACAKVRYTQRVYLT